MPNGRYSCMWLGQRVRNQVNARVWHHSRSWFLFCFNTVRRRSHGAVKPFMYSTCTQKMISLPDNQSECSMLLVHKACLICAEWVICHPDTSAKLNYLNVLWTHKRNSSTFTHWNFHWTSTEIFNSTQGLIFSLIATWSHIPNSFKYAVGHLSLDSCRLAGW